MTLHQFFKKVVQSLKKEKLQFALAGGLIASIYREAPRATKDLDILIFSEENSIQIATQIIESFGLQAHPIRKAELEGGPMFAIKRKSTPIYIIAGRSEDKTSIGLDLILPNIPWATTALERAQENSIDFGFGPVPCLSPEDVVLSKLYAIQNRPDRFMDMDDLKSIFNSEIILNLDYLSAEFKRLNLKIPKLISSSIPKDVRKVLK